MLGNPFVDLFSLYSRRSFLLISLAFENPLSITLSLYPRFFSKSQSLLGCFDMKWTHGDKELDEFLEHANNIHPSIKFTHGVSKTKMSFLDTTTTVKEGNMTTDLYSKPTDKHQYLSPSRCHQEVISVNFTGF
jgi:hypothetical protein